MNQKDFLSAIRKGDIDKVKEYIKSEEDYNLSKSFLLALKSEQYEVAQYLSSLGVNLDNYNLYETIEKIIMNHKNINMDFIKQLLSCGINVSGYSKK